LGWRYLLFLFSIGGFFHKINHLRPGHLKPVLFNHFKHLQAPGGKPHFVNKNNAFRGFVDGRKINIINGIKQALKISKSVSGHSSHARLTARRRLRQ